MALRHVGRVVHHHRPDLRRTDPLGSVVGSRADRAVLDRGGHPVQAQQARPVLPSSGAAQEVAVHARRARRTSRHDRRHPVRGALGRPTDADDLRYACLFLLNKKTAYTGAGFFTFHHTRLSTVR